MSLLKNLTEKGTPPAEAPRATLIQRRAGLQPVAGTASTPIPENMVSTVIETQDIIPDESRVGVRKGYTHVSTLVNACARREIIANFHTTEMIRRVTSGDRVVWALGRAVEKHVRKQFLKARNNRGVYGKWVCTCEHHSHVGMVPEQTLCPKCETPRARFLENPVFDEEAWIVGNCDLPFMHGEYLVPLEIKSIKRDGAGGFEDLEAPKGDHVLQALIYRDLYQRQGWKVHDEIILYYVCKDYPNRRIRSIYKEFHVNGTSTSAQSMVSLAREVAFEIKRAVQSRQIPERTCCTAPSSPMARDCPVANLCWNL